MGLITEESNVFGTVVASDTQVTANTKESMLKIFQLGQMPILVEGSGAVSFSRHLISKSGTTCTKLPKQAQTKHVM